MYGNLIKEMKISGVTIDDVAKTMQSHRNTASNKIYGRTQLSLEEAEMIWKEHFPYCDFQELFKKSNQH